MSLQVCAAGSSSVPCPSRLTPTSLITTLAPSRAMHRANSRPMPRPEPVTIATRPSRIPIRLLCSLRFDGRGGRAGQLLLAVLVPSPELEVDQPAAGGLGQPGDPRREGE